jgi:hypothetical protein
MMMEAYTETYRTVSCPLDKLKTLASALPFADALFIHSVHKHAVWYLLCHIRFLLLLPFNSFLSKRFALNQGLSTFLKASVHKEL